MSESWSFGDMPGSFPLTKFLHPSDYAHLGPELTQVDRFAPPNGHEHRRWEYAMALRALAAWVGQLDPAVPVTMCRALDVGGCGSPLAQILVRAGLGGVRVIDPSLESGPTTLEEYLAGGGGAEAVVTCVSVLEHVPDSAVGGFLEALTRAVRPGGLLFLTADACEDDPASSKTFPHDAKHFCWMRARIFGPRSWRGLQEKLVPYGFEPLGGVDWTYRGPQVYDYTFASMALVKRR